MWVCFTFCKNDLAVPASGKTLLTGDDPTKLGRHVPAGHQGGALLFEYDGKLYIAMGEQTADAPSQKLDSFLGKNLRVNPDGSLHVLLRNTWGIDNQFEPKTGTLLRTRPTDTTDTEESPKEPS